MGASHLGDGDPAGAPDVAAALGFAHLSCIRDGMRPREAAIIPGCARALLSPHHRLGDHIVGEQSARPELAPDNLTDGDLLPSSYPPPPRAWSIPTPRAPARNAPPSMPTAMSGNAPAPADRLPCSTAHPPPMGCAPVGSPGQAVSRSERSQRATARALSLSNPTATKGVGGDREQHHSGKNTERPEPLTGRQGFPQDRGGEDKRH